MLTTVLIAVASCSASCLGQPPPRFAAYKEQDALAYELVLDVRHAQKKLSGTVQYRFRAEKALETIRLDAKRGPDWHVTFRDEAGRELQTTWSKDQVLIRLPRKALAGSEVEFSAEISGTPVDGFYFKKNRYGEPLAFTDHYSIRARGWLPCEDHPSDRARFKVELTFPEGNCALASGGPIGHAAQESGPPLLRRETRSDIPPYMFAIVVGPYAQLAEKGDKRLRPHLVYRQDLAKAKRALVHHAEWIKVMEETFGPYAYTKYRVVQCPTRWGGFEAPGNVQLAERIFDGRRQGVGTLAHELIHMWFGDGVGYADWHEVWLSEGFASYFGPWLDAKTGGPAFTKSLRNMRSRWLRSRDGRIKSIRWDGFPHPDLALNTNTYPKAAWVLHMLRGELGDPLFFSALRRYFEKHAGHSVVTTDFVESIQKSTGRDLGWFFDQWLNRVGCPKLRLEETGGEGEGGEGERKVTVEQLQKGAPYRFRLPLEWTDGEGKQVKRHFVIQERRQELEIAGAKRGSLVVDPDVELLFRPAT